MSISGQIAATLPAAAAPEAVGGALAEAAVELLAPEGAGADELALEEELLEQPARASPQTTVVARSSARFTVTPFEGNARADQTHRAMRCALYRKQRAAAAHPPSCGLG